MKLKQYMFAFVFIALNILSICSQEKKNLDDYKKLGRDSIIGCAKHELMHRHKKLGLNIKCYSRIEVLAGIEDGKEALYVNFDNPIRFREIVNPDRIGINLLGGESYYSSRGDIENFYCNQGSILIQDFLNCLSKAQTGGSLIALPGTNSPTSSYVNVIDYGDYYSFTIVSGSLGIRYSLKKSDCSLKEMNREKTEDNSKPYLEEIK